MERKNHPPRSELPPLSVALSRSGPPNLPATACKPKKKPRKRAHYLRHSQRCTIIQRINDGEKQAALAREYKITRAAISAIYKNREDILAQTVDDESGSESEDDDEDEDQTIKHKNVTEIRSDAVLVRLTTLRDVKSTAMEFHRAATRLITVLLEEAFAVVGTEAVERIGGTGESYTGLERKYEFCGITFGDETLPFATIFRQLEGRSRQGSIQAGELPESDGKPTRWHISKVDIPSDIKRFKVLIFSCICGDYGREVRAIEALRSLGVHEKEIAIVAILSSSRGIDMIANQFPKVRVITAAIEDHVTAGPYETFSGLAAFIDQFRQGNKTNQSAWV